MGSTAAATAAEAALSLELAAQLLTAIILSTIIIKTIQLKCFYTVQNVSDVRCTGCKVSDNKESVKA